MVQEETYFLQLVRYIHLNGVKALLYPHAGADPNCSHGFYMGLRPAPRWLCREHREARWAFCYLLRNHSQLENRIIGELLCGLSYSGVSRLLARNNYDSSQKLKDIEAQILSSDTVSNGKT